MAEESPRRRYSYSPSPRGGGRSRSRSPAPYKRETRDEYESRDDRREPREPPVKEEEIVNPGNNLYVTGLSTRVTEQDLQDYFTREGKVLDCRLVVDPRSRESRGFGFVTMDTLEDAERCIKRLNHSNLEGRIITVEKAKRKRARTPTPGRYLGNRSATVRSFGGGRRDYRDDYHRGGGGGGGGGGGHHGSSYRRSPRYSPYRGGRDDYDRSPDYRHRRDRSPDYSPHGRSHRRSPDYGRRERDRSPVPYYRH